jgi:uncharacterized membrane protein
MNMPPPPGQPGIPTPPPGYNPYGAVPAPQKNNGLGIAGFVLSLVGIIPCFWGFQIPGLLGLIFGLIGRSKIKQSNGAQKGAGLALAAIIIGAILVLAAIALWVYIATSGDCTFEDNQLRCVTD